MLFMRNDVVAQENSSTTEDAQIQQMSEINDLFTSISSAIYALLWPVLFVAGIALDNRLVYGSFLHLDASLWTLWNIMKNFANFALWFMVLFAIVRNIFTAPFGKSGDKRGPVTIIKKTLIAGVLIQASWFLIAAVIDVSTILTYSIWWLPMTVMQNNPDQSDLPILWVSANLNTRWDKQKMNLTYYNTYGDSKIANCATKKVPWLTWEYIVGRKDIKVDDEIYFESWLCTLWSWPYRYKENPAFVQTGNDTYHRFLENYFSSGTTLTTSGFAELESGCNIIPTAYSKLNSNCLGQNYWILKKSDNFFKTNQDNTKGIAYTIDTLLDKSKWFVGPFITIYSSLLDFSTITSPAPGDSVLSDFLELIIKLFFAIVLFFPLVALAIVLIARIWILWIVIAASPIMVLLAVFKDLFSIKSSSDWLMWNFTGPNIIKLIFAPVFVVFAISMSMIFLSALNPKSISKNQWLTDDQMVELGMNKINDETYSILGLVEITLDVNKVNKWMNMFAWFITMLFSTGIIRFFLFFAIRMTKIWESVGKWIQESMQDLASNLPIIPITDWWIWINAAKQWLKDLSNKIPNQLQRAQEQSLKEKYPWLYGPTWDEDRWEAGSLTTLAKFDLDKVINSIREKGIATAFEQNKELLSKANITDQASLTTAFNSYVTNNANSFTTEQFIWKWEDSKEGITTYDAERFDAGTIENMVINQDDWKSWAKGVVWGNVKTADWLRVMANIGTHDNPEFKLLKPDEYNKKYLITKKGWSLDDKAIQESFNDQYAKSTPPTSPEKFADWENEKQKLYNKITKENEDRLAALSNKS